MTAVSYQYFTMMRSLGLARSSEVIDCVRKHWRDRSGSEASQKKALCEAMIAALDELEVRPRWLALYRWQWEALRADRRILESEIYP
mgnify:CR=1 FL=1